MGDFLISHSADSCNLAAHIIPLFRGKKKPQNSFEKKDF
jgi:hypothetical protein